MFVFRYGARVTIKARATAIGAHGVEYGGRSELSPLSRATRILQRKPATSGFPFLSQQAPLVLSDHCRLELCRQFNRTACSRRALCPSDEGPARSRHFEAVARAMDHACTCRVLSLTARLPTVLRWNLGRFHFLGVVYRYRQKESLSGRATHPPDSPPGPARVRGHFLDGAPCGVSESVMVRDNEGAWHGPCVLRGC